MGNGDGTGSNQETLKAAKELGKAAESLDQAASNLGEALRNPAPSPTPSPAGQGPEARASSGNTNAGRRFVESGNGDIERSVLERGADILKDFAVLSSFQSLLGVSKSTLDVIHEIGQYGNKIYDPMQKAMGGLQNIADIQNETVRSQFNAVNSIMDAYFENGKTFSANNRAFMVETATAAKTEVNALFAYFKKPEEIIHSLGAVTDALKEEQILRLNDLTETEKTYLGTFEKGFNVSSDKIANVMKRNIALTGKASVDVFGEISNFSTAVADKTGVDYKQIASVTMDLITDVQRFGNVQVEEASRIAGALAELGISYQQFGSMVDKFMNFDSAAESLGNLTTLFGVHFDAMEMMMLANEDQEEFLHRIRESFLETGKSVEDMTLAEKKLAATQLSMDVQSFENFMNAEREATDTSAATREAAKKDFEDGFQTMTQNMSLVKRSTDEMQEYMRGKLMNPLKESAHQTGVELALVSGHMKDIVSSLDAYKGLEEFVQATFEGVAQTDRGARREIEQKIKDMVEQGEFGDYSSATVSALSDYAEFLKTNQFTKLSFKERVIDADGVESAKMSALLTKLYGETFADVEQRYSETMKKDRDMYLDTLEKREKSEIATLRAGGAKVTEATFTASREISETQAREQLAEAQEAKRQAEARGMQGHEDYQKLLARIAYLERVEEAGGLKKDKPVKLFFTGESGEKIEKMLAGGSEIDLGTGFRMKMDASN